MAQPVFSGNTKEKKRERHRNWFFTLNNYNQTEILCLQQWFGTDAEYVFQEETGEKGTPHLQGCFFMKNPVEFDYLKKHWDRWHIEVCKDKKAAIKYCTKEQTRTGKIYTNMQIRKPVRDPMNGLKLYEWQQEILDLIKEPGEMRKIYWFWEPNGNAGKSCFCKHLCLKYGAVICSGKGADIKYCIAQLLEERDVDIILMDIPRVAADYVSYQAIEEVKNGLFFCTKYESKQIIMNPPHIFIFANFEPDTKTMSADRWVIKRL